MKKSFFWLGQRIIQNWGVQEPHELIRYCSPIYVLYVSSHFWPFTKAQIWFWKISTKTWALVRPPLPCWAKSPSFSEILMAPLIIIVKGYVFRNLKLVIQISLFQAPPFLSWSPLSSWSNFELNTNTLKIHSIWSVHAFNNLDSIRPWKVKGGIRQNDTQNVFYLTWICRTGSLWKMAMIRIRITALGAS